jgi:hypothetical protein
MRRLSHIALVIFIFGFSIQTKAHVIFDFHSTYLFDQFEYSTSSGSNLLVYATSLNYSINRAKAFYLGWNILGINQSVQNGTLTDNFETLDMGPKLLWVSTSGTYQAGFSYLLKNTTQYKQGSNDTVALQGTSFLAELAILSEITEKMKLGVKLNYYYTIWSESLVGNATSPVNFSRSVIIPTLAFNWAF